MPHQNSGVKFENSSIYITSKSFFSCGSIESKKTNGWRVMFLLMDMIDVDVVCVRFLSLCLEDPGPKDIMIQNDWLMAVCLRLIKENVRCEGVWLQRRKFHCSFKNACIYIIYHGQFLSVNTLNRNNPDLKLLDAYHLFTNLHQHSVWDNSQSWTTVDIYVSLILTGGIFSHKKWLASWKSVVKNLSKAARSWSSRAGNCWLGTWSTHECCWFESKASWQNVFLVGWFLLIILKSRRGHTKDILIFQKLYVWRIHVRLPGFSCCFLSDFKFWYDFVKTPHKLHQSPSKVWFHQCFAA